MKTRPRLANSVLARAEAYREGLLFGLSVPSADVHPLETVTPPVAAPPQIEAGVDDATVVAQAQGGSALDSMMAQSVAE